MGMLFLGNLMILAILINASVEFFEFSFKYIKKEKIKSKGSDQFYCFPCWFGGDTMPVKTKKWYEPTMNHMD